MTDIVNRPPDGPVVDVPVVDVVVVGAGIAGASAADALSRAGLTTVLVETEAQPGHHATGRSAATLSETSGHPVVCALAAASRPFFADPPAGFVDHALLSPRGLVWIGLDSDTAALDALAESGRAIAPTVRRLTTDEVIAVVPGLRAHAASGGGVHEPDAMSVDVAALLAGYLRRARQHGAEILPAHEAIEFSRTAGGGWRVTTGARSFEATAVVNAAGAWGDVVAARAGIRPLGLRALRRTACIVPVKTDVAAWPLVMDIANRFYFEPEPGGLLLSPADETESEPTDARAEELDLALALERLDEATDLAPRSIRHSWAGLRTFSPDRAPVLGPDPDEPTFVWCVGQAGAGIKTAPAAAEVIAAAVTAAAFPERLTAWGLTPEGLGAARFR